MLEAYCQKCTRLKYSFTAQIRRYLSSGRSGAVLCKSEAIKRAPTSLFSFNLKSEVKHLQFQALYPKFKHFSNLENTSYNFKHLRISSTPTNPVDWKSPKPPSYSIWLKGLVFFLKLEKVKYTLRGSVDSFYKKWQCLIDYFNNLQTLPT